MSLTTETGSGSSTAESYISEVDADTYHENRGNTAWAAISNKEALLRRATDFMLQMFRQRWKGYRKTATQSLDWPRSFVYTEPFVHGAVGAYPYLVSDTIVPTEVKNACAELALKAYTGTLMPDKKQSIKKKVIGPITFEYDQYSTQAKQYSSIDAMLAPYLNSNGGISVQLVK